jgi:type II restriction enzyme
LITLDFDIAKRYKSNSQKIRVVAENWTNNNVYCSYCGKPICQYENNRPVVDFYCNNDHEEFELKSKKAKSITKKIIAGQYDIMYRANYIGEKPKFVFAFLS